MLDAACAIKQHYDVIILKGCTGTSPMTESDDEHEEPSFSLMSKTSSYRHMKISQEKEMKTRLCFKFLLNVKPTDC